MIPRQVHRLWLGPDPMPDEYVAYGRTWKAHGYELWDWTEETMPPPINRRTYDAIARTPVNVGGGKPELGVWVQRADILGYELVWRYGGIYVNCDVECVRPLDPILEGVGAFAGWEIQDQFLCNAVMGGTRRHPFWWKCVEELAPRYRRMWRQPMNEVTGPHYLTAQWRAHGAAMNVTAFPQEYFYPFSYLEMDREWDDHPDAYLRHHWGHTRGRWSDTPTDDHLAGLGQ